jgi:hypothetical protein
MLRAVVIALALVTAGSAAGKTRLPGIRSPSGNIRCFVVPRPTVLRCEIGVRATRRSYRRDVWPRKGAGVDWHGFELTATGGGAITCSGGILYNPDTQRPAFTTLPYCKTWSHEPFTCVSRSVGLTCTNRVGHGLFISRDSWRAW